MGLLINIVVIAAWMGLVLLLAVLTRRIWPEHKELSRKIVHIGTGPVLPLAWWLQIPATLAVPIAMTITVATLINQQRWHWLQAVEDIDRQSYGTVTYGLAITILLLLFWPNHPQAACAGVVVMAAADGLAGLIGRATHSHRWQIWKQTKSIAGTLTMAVVSLTVLAVLAWIGPNDPGIAGLLAISLFATGLEQVGPWGIDNLTVPLAVGLSWQWLTS